VGGGMGLSVRKRGWMCDSDRLGLADAPSVGVLLRFEVMENAVGGRWICESTERDESDVGGRSVNRSLDGNECNDGCDSERPGKGPSSALAGLTGRLPGIGSSAVPLVGTARCTVSLNCWSMLEVSQLSKASAGAGMVMEWASEIPLWVEDLDTELRGPSSFCLEFDGRTAWWIDSSESRHDARRESDEYVDGAWACGSAYGGATIRRGVGGVGGRCGADRFGSGVLKESIELGPSDVYRPKMTMA
jgi:hypothetical protein